MLRWAPSKKSKFLELLDDVIDQPTRDINPIDAAHKEIQKYLCIGVGNTPKFSCTAIWFSTPGN